MRKKAERQLPLDFAGTQKLTKEWYFLYRNIHEILELNPAVTDLVHEDLTRGEKKLKRNVEGVSSESILRLVLVQQIEMLSVRETIVRVDDSQMLRFFCRFYDDPLISHSIYSTLCNMIAPETWEKINEFIVRFARDKKGFKGKHLRIDTTAVEKCVHQARERVLNETPVPHGEKLFSIFEPHTELLIRGKAGKEIEFGHMLEIQQIEGGLITGHKVHEKRPSEPPLVEQAVARHVGIFGHNPKCVAGDKGFYSKEVVTKVELGGVEQVCIPKKGRRNEEEEQKEKSFWFKTMQAFRAGIEGTVSVLKRAFGLKRCLREGFEHFKSWVSTGVLAHNLVLLSRK